MSFPDVKEVVSQLKIVAQKTSKFTNERILNSLGVANALPVQKKIPKKRKFPNL